MTIIEHLETHLGLIDYGWKDSSSIQVVKFRNQPFEQVFTYSTLGLSNSILELPNDKNVRQELIFSCYSDFKSEAVASLLISFSEHIIETGKGLLRGQVIGPGNPLINDVSALGLYSSIPIFFDDSFHVFEDHTPPIVFVWLMPLLADEIKFVREEGWEKFEDILEKANCDFWDLNRKSVLISKS